MTQLDLGLWQSIGGVIGIMGIGAMLPLWLHRTGDYLSIALSASAGVLLASALLHLIPEATARLGHQAGLGVLVGFVFLYLFERFVTVHVCETFGCHVHTIGVSALFGLSLHTFANGVALGAGVVGGVGGVVFIALAAHKLPEAFSLTSILLHEKYRRRQVLWMNLLLMSMIPLGAWAVRGVAIGADQQTITAWALAFSAGTFLHIAVSDLLPEVHRKSSHGTSTAVAFLCGIAVMVITGHLFG